MTKYEALCELGLDCRYQYCELVQSPPKCYSPYFRDYVNILVYRQWDTYKQVPLKENRHLILVFCNDRCIKTLYTTRPFYTLQGLESLIFNEEF